jgi:hypothetical protein
VHPAGWAWQAGKGHKTPFADPPPFHPCMATAEAIAAREHTASSGWLCIDGLCLMFFVLILGHSSSRMAVRS